MMAGQVEDARPGLFSTALAGNVFGAGTPEFFQLFFVNEPFPLHHKNHLVGLLQPGVGPPKKINHGNQEHLGYDQGHDE
jgi:hypothetical protein